MKTKEQCLLDVPDVVEDAQEAFWAVVAKHFKEEIKSGDLTVHEIVGFDAACGTVVERWIENNYPGEANAS